MSGRYTSADDEELILVGVRLDPDTSEPNFHTLLIYGGNDRPVTCSGRILWFDDPMKVELAADRSHESLERFALPTELAIVYDLAESLYLIESQEADSSGFIINCLNALFDFVKAAGITPPQPEYNRLLEFADHMTFTTDIAEFFANSDTTRQRILNSILWSVGAVAVKSTTI